MSGFPTEVVDEEGRVFVVDRAPIGRGGQGVVFRTRDPDIAVKFIVPPGEEPLAAAGARVGQRLHEHLTRAPAEPLPTSWQAQGRLRTRLDDVRLLPLPRLHLARPLSLLRNHPGYTMQLLRGMVPIRTLIAEPGEEKLADFYRAGGGLRRRLHLLGRAASLLLRLHGMPVAYGDVSPSNVFVSAAVDEHEVWFIDADNLAFESVAGEAVHTRGYGAPELVQGVAGVTTLSDAWSFAVLAFEALTQVHPLVGDHVDEGGWDEVPTREDLAFAGRLPWIDDRDSDLNRTQRGMYPRETVISPNLEDLFRRMFGPGRVDRAERPSVAAFAEALRGAADATLACPRCGGTFYVTRAHCPRCPDAVRPAFLHAQVSRIDPVSEDEERGLPSTSQAVHHAVADANEGVPSVLRRHVVRPTLESEDDPPALELLIQRGRFVITPRDGGEYWLAADDGRLTRLESARPADHLPTEGREVHIHCGPRDEPRRVVSIRYWEGER